MMTEEARQYLIRAFGTGEIGNCSKCNKREDKIHGRRFVKTMACGKSECLMALELELFNQSQYDKLQRKLGYDASPFQSKIAKLNFLGFDEFPEPPWLIMRSPTGGEYWFNPKQGTYGARLYEKINVFKDIIICGDNVKQLKNGFKQKAEMYSTQCGSMNILYDFPDAVYVRQGLQIGHSSIEYLGYAIFKVVDKTSGFKMHLIASKYGTRLAVNRSDSIQIEAYDGGLLITLRDVGSPKKVLRADAELKLLRTSQGVIALNI